MKIELTFPDELFIALKEQPDSFRNKIMIYTLGKLYEMGHISGGLGASILGCDRWVFYRLLSENGFAVIDYADNELEKEAEVDEIWLKRIQIA